MINAETIREIINLYEKHGWQLRRVLLTGELGQTLENSLETLFGTAEIAAGEIDGAWFSRPSKGADEAWELRHLSKTPFAIIEVFDANLDEDEVDDILQTAEMRLADRLEAKR